MINALIAGDIWLAPSLSTHKKELNSALEKIKGDKEFDIFLCNLEAPLKSELPRVGRRALLYLEHSLLQSLKIADINVLSLANNHITDFGSDGLVKTIEECRNKGFYVIGAGNNIFEARKPLVLDVNGRKIAIMAYAETSPYVGSIAATKNKAGIAPLDIDMIQVDISNIRKTVDDIWLFLHWGKEFIRYPMPWQIKISRRLIESGVTFIVGHHPHLLLGHQMANNSYIYYSMGNFIFPNIPLQDGSTLVWDDLSRTSMALNVQLDNNTFSVDKQFLYLDSYGLPQKDIDSSAGKIFNKISESYNDPSYDRKYKYFFLMEKIKRTITKYKYINKIWKDVQWRFRRD